MSEAYRRIKKPRCFLVYAKAPEGMSPSEANRTFNNFIADPGLPLAIYHDHFIGEPGGLAIFYAETTVEREALFDQSHLEEWQVEIQPLIYSYSPAAFDEQIAFTLGRYRQTDWETLRRDRRPSYGDPSTEAETGEERLD
jgi:hypothetical protein